MKFTQPVIEVEVTNEDFKNADNFMSISDCPLATALKRMFPGEYVSVGGTSVSLGAFKSNYKINNWFADLNQNSTEVTIACNRIITAAKAGEFQKSHNVKLSLIL